MKCLCGYSHSPNNTVVLKKHIEDCMVAGPLQTLEPVVIWRDGEFQVVVEASETDQIIDVDWKRPRVSVVAIEKLAALEAVRLEAVVETASSPEEAAAAVEEIVAEEIAAEEEVVEEKPKPAPKKRTPRKKPTTDQ